MNAIPDNLKRMDHVPGISPATAILIEEIRGGNPGESVKTDEALTTACGKDTRPNCNGYTSLQTAIRYCERHYSIVWKRRPGANCIECLSPTQTIDLSERHRAHVSRVTKRSVRQLQTIDADELPTEGRKRLGIRLAQMGTLAAFSATTTTKKLEAREISKPVDMGRLLEAMS